MKFSYGSTTYNNHWLFQFSSPREVVGRVALVIAFLTVIAMGAICFYNAFQWVNKPFAGFLMHRRLVVSVTGVPSWTGIRAGLRPADKILQIDRNPVVSVKDLEKATRSKEVGTLIEYTVQRGERVFSVSAPTMLFSFSDFLMTFGSSLLMGVIFLAIGTVVFILKPDIVVSWLFFGITLLQSVLFLCEFELASTLTPFSYVYIFCDTLQPALVLHFSANFPYKFGFASRRCWLIRSPYIVSTLLFIFYVAIFPSSFFYTSYYIIMYPYMYLGLLTFLTALLYSYFRGESPLSKQRARVIFWGALFAFPLPLLAAVISNTGAIDADISLFTNLTSLPVIIFPVAIAYSITRHNLFDVDVYIKRAVGYALMTVIVGSTYLVLQITLKSVIFASLLGKSAEYIYPVIFALLVVFFFNPINRRVKDVVDRVFFRKSFDYKETIIAISDALSSVLNIEEIVHQVIGAVRKEMFIDNAGIIVLDQQRGPRSYFVADKDDGVLHEKNIDNETGLRIIDMLTQQRRLITCYEIAESPEYAQDRENYLERFHNLGMTMAIPMIYQDQVNAVVMVGRKKSGQFFSKEDVELLTTLASHGAVSIENARMAEQMKHEETVRTNLARYLSPQIVDGIVKSDMQVNLGGNRKVVTVLFSDIRDFTKITENQPADQLVRMLNEYFNAMAECIFNNRGSLDKYIGDAMVAVFGSLVPLEKPEDHAVKTAVDMMQRLEELNKEWESRGDFPMHMGIGICTGEVFLGNIGSVERMEFTVIGDTVNMASRLSDKAAAGQIIIAETVRSHLSHSICTEELPPVEIKGKKGLHKVFKVVYAKSHQSPKGLLSEVDFRSSSC